MGKKDSGTVRKSRPKKKRVLSGFFHSALIIVFLLVSLGCAAGTVYDLSEVLHGGWGSGKGEFGLIEEEGFVTGPTNFIVDYSGNIYVADSVNFRVLQFSQSGKFTNALNFVSADPEEPLIVHYTTCDGDGNLYVLILNCEANLVKFSRDGLKLFLRRFPLWFGRNAICPPLSLFRSDVKGRIYIVDGSSKRRLKIYTALGEFDRSVEMEKNFSVSPWGEAYLFSGQEGYVNCEVFDMGGTFVRRFRIPASFGSELIRLPPGEIYFGPGGEIYFSRDEGGNLFMRIFSRDGQFLQDVPLGEISIETGDHGIKRGGKRGYAAGRDLSLLLVDPRGRIFRSVARGGVYRILKYSPRAMRKKIIFEGSGPFHDVLRDGQGRIHILTDQGIYLLDTEKGRGMLQAFPIKGMYRKFCFSKDRGYLIYEAERGGLLMLSPEGTIVYRVAVMKMRGIEVRGFRGFIERDEAVFADFGSGKIYRIGDKGDLTFVLEKDRMSRKGGAFVKITKGGYVMKTAADAVYDSYRVLDGNGEMIGNYEFGSDTLIEDVKVVGEDREGIIYIWCGLSRGGQLHLWTPRGDLEEILHMDDSLGPVRWSDIIVSDRREVFCVMRKKGGFEIIKYFMPEGR